MKSGIIRRNEFKKYHQDNQPTVISKRIYRRQRQRSKPIEIASNKLEQHFFNKISKL